jgi:hypothetical protein
VTLLLFWDWFQSFEETKPAQDLITKLKAAVPVYWKANCEKVGYLLNKTKPRPAKNGGGRKRGRSGKEKDAEVDPKLSDRAVVNLVDSDDEGSDRRIAETAQDRMAKTHFEALQAMEKKFKLERRRRQEIQEQLQSLEKLVKEQTAVEVLDVETGQVTTKQANGEPSHWQCSMILRAFLVELGTHVLKVKKENVTETDDLKEDLKESQEANEFQTMVKVTVAPPASPDCCSFRFPSLSSSRFPCPSSSSSSFPDPDPSSFPFPSSCR